MKRVFRLAYLAAMWEDDADTLKVRLAAIESRLSYLELRRVPWLESKLKGMSGSAESTLRLPRINDENTDGVSGSAPDVSACPLSELTSQKEALMIFAKQFERFERDKEAEMQEYREVLDRLEDKVHGLEDFKSEYSSLNTQVIENREAMERIDERLEDLDRICEGEFEGVKLRLSEISDDLGDTRQLLASLDRSELSTGRRPPSEEFRSARAQGAGGPHSYEARVASPNRVLSSARPPSPQARSPGAHSYEPVARALMTGNLRKSDPMPPPMLVHTPSSSPQLRHRQVLHAPATVLTSPRLSQANPSQTVSSPSTGAVRNLVRTWPKGTPRQR